MTFACLSMKDLVDILKIRISNKSHKGTVLREIQWWDDISSFGILPKLWGSIPQEIHGNHILHFWNKLTSISFYRKFQM